MNNEKPRIVVSMDEPKSIAANWKRQFYLRVISPLGNPIGEGWYDDGAKATISVTSPIGVLTQQAFVRWSGDVISSSRDTTVLMDSPKAAVAEWTTDFTQLQMLVGALSALIGMSSVAVMQRARKA